MDDWSILIPFGTLVLFAAMIVHGLVHSIRHIPPASRK